MLQPSAEDVPNRGKGHRVVEFEFFRFFLQVPVFDRLGYRRVKDFLFFRIRGYSLLDFIVDNVEDARHGRHMRRLDLAEVDDQFVGGFGKCKGPAAQDVRVQIGGQTETVRPGKNAQTHFIRISLVESLVALAGVVGHVAVVQHHAFRIAGGARGVDDKGRLRPVRLVGRGGVFLARLFQRRQ
ncbi:MAG: hypothetical protein BWX45_00386 [Deltaproteobacteria bacterium ADurb.Bin002]|nr:MAG: hypothetical protein BWX45_00386 [Deltaproteobacteria bacterium ADurb.Bin002]